MGCGCSGCGRGNRRVDASSDQESFEAEGTVSALNVLYSQFSGRYVGRKGAMGGTMLVRQRAPSPDYDPDKGMRLG